ncbi:MAG TPA: hypothetical protein VE090_04360 [Methylomirabilota bacterium]|nr:hypothetical protein [Methylomirabilota bacterium]
MIIMVIIVIVVAAGAFFGGMKYQQGKTAGGMITFGNGQYGQGQGGQRGQGSQGRLGGRSGMGGATVGEVVSVDANSVTIKLQDGSSKIVNLSTSTTISKTDTASKSDLKKGDRIAAFGMSNSDGSITAQNIQLNPMFRVGGAVGQSGSMRPQPTQ